jgi:hypothetical protein
MASHVHDAAQWFIRAFCNALEANNGGEEEVELALSRIRAQNTRATELQDQKPERLPACRFLPDVVAATLLVAPDVAAAMAALEEDLHWMRNPNFTNEETAQPGFMENYASAEIIGPDGLYPGQDCRLGLTLLGPGVLYPPHAQPAPELCWILTGTSEWKVRDEPFDRREPGDAIWHEPFVPHAIKVGNTPLLYVFVWTSEVERPALLV